MGFQPTDEDLDFPGKLERLVQMRASPDGTAQVRTESTSDRPAAPANGSTEAWGSSDDGSRDPLLAPTSRGDAEVGPFKASELARILSKEIQM